MSMEMLLTLFAAGVVLARVICLASRLDRQSFEGHVAQFLALAAGHALLFGGAVAALIMPHWSPLLLLIGAALMFLSDRRSPLT